MFYLDTSAAAKLVLVERGSTALRRWMKPHERRVFSSDLLRTELLRTIRREASDQMVSARAVLEGMLLVRLSTKVCERAVSLEPSVLRSLDALHLAAAMEVGDELEGFVTYDARLAAAALANGIEVIAPS